NQQIIETIETSYTNEQLGHCGRKNVEDQTPRLVSQYHKILCRSFGIGADVRLQFRKDKVLVRKSFLPGAIKVHSCYNRSNNTCQRRDKSWKKKCWKCYRIYGTNKRNRRHSKKKCGNFAR